MTLTEQEIEQRLEKLREQWKTAGRHDRALIERRASLLRTALEHLKQGGTQPTT